MFGSCVPSVSRYSECSVCSIAQVFFTVQQRKLITIHFVFDCVDGCRWTGVYTVFGLVSGSVNANCNVK